MLCLELGCSLFTAMSGVFCKGKGEGRGVALHSSVRHEGVASQPCRVGGRKGGGGAGHGAGLFTGLSGVWGRKERGLVFPSTSHGGGERRASSQIGQACTTNRLSRGCS